VTKNKDIMVGAASIVISIILFIASFRVREMFAATVDAGFVPRIVATVLALLGVILIVRQVRANASAPARASAPAAAQGPKETPVGMVGTLPVVLNIILFIAYLLALAPLGFIIATSAYMFLQILLLSEPAKINIPWYLFISVAVCTGAYYLFVKFFQVILPVGILG